MRVAEAFLLQRAQGGWHCSVTYYAETSEQFTVEAFLYVSGSRWLWLALVKGWWGAWREQRRVEQEHRAGRIANGWGVK